MQKMIYAIRDTIANDIIGGLQLFAHDAVAIRFFGDVATQRDTIVARHIEDHALVFLGFLTEDGELISEIPRIVISGKQWAAAQTTTGGQE